MRQLIEIQEAADHLQRLRDEYDAEGSPLDPREVRQKLEYWTEQVAIMRGELDVLCMFAHALNPELAKQHGVKEIPPF